MNTDTEIIGILLVCIILILFGIYADLTNKKPVDPKQQRIQDWKRNKKKWAKHKF